jgi:hypothetical protein
MKKISSLFVKGISILPALLVMPAMATNYAADDLTGINSVVGNTFGNNVDGNVTLNLLGTSSAPITISGTDWFNGVYGIASLVDAGSDSIYSSMKNNYYTSTRAEHFVPSKEDLNDGKWSSLVTGNLNMTLNYTTVDHDVFGTFYKHIDTGNLDSTKSIGVKGKTTITLNNSVVKGDLRGGNGEGVVSTDVEYLAGKAKLGDIELNINDSLVEDEVVAVGGYMSAGNVKINVTGNSSIGYDVDGNVVSGEDGWIIAGAQRPGGTIQSTEINLNTNGASKIIKIAGDVHTGSREHSNSTKNSSENSVVGDAILNMFGGGTINVGGDLRAYHVAGNTELNINDVATNVAGNIANEFKTINMNENAILNANTLTMKSGDTLNMTLLNPDTYSQINVDTLDANGATLNMVVKNAGTYNLVNADNVTSDFAWNTQNAVFDLEEDNGVVTATVKSAESIVASNQGISSDTGKMISALANSDDNTASQMSVTIQESLANGDADYVEQEVSKMNPEKAPVITSMALSIQNQVLAAAGERMALPLTGRSGGDIKADLGVWAKGMYNYTKHKDTFTGNTWGGSVGIDTDLNHSVILGAGYSFGITNVDMNSHDADINSNTVFVYGQYRNSDWFVNGTIAYTMSEYDWNKTVFGVHTDPSYKVNSLSEQIMGGYHFANGITPTLGLRYLDVHQDAYKDGIVSVNDIYSKYLTGVIGMDFKNAWVAPHSSIFWNPELHLAATYDMISDSDVALVMVPGAAAYTLEADSLSRLGGEFGIGLTAEYYYLTVSLNYDLNIRKDFSSQTGSLKVKYKF